MSPCDCVVVSKPDTLELERGCLESFLRSRRDCGQGVTMTKLSSTKHAIQDLKAIGQMVFSISSLIGNLIPKRWVAYYITWYRPEHLHHHGAKDINHITRSPSLYSQFFNLCWDPVSFCPIRYRDCQRHVVFQYNEYCAQRSTWRRDASALEGYCLPTDCQDSCRY